MRFLLLTITLLLSLSATAQTYNLTGKVIDERNMPLPLAEVIAVQKAPAKLKTLTDTNGSFTLNPEKKGKYHISITHPGYETYEDSVIIGDSALNLGAVHMIPAIHMLEEVKIVEKVLAMVQKDDTMEYNAGAYKVNPDADAADMVKKMPSIDLSNKKITAQGESVIKVLVDGKPFFGEDPYAALKNLPAEVIDKVQVYNEKTDQERFTGFSEGPTSKTINIITKPNKRKGVFGSIYAGNGADLSPDVVEGHTTAELAKYGTGATLNNFGGDRRFTLTAQANNINSQNFTEQAVSTGGGSTGTTTTNAAGINYSDKWGKKTDISGSYFFNNTDNSAIRVMRRDYVLSTDSGQVYKESSPSDSKSYNHRANFRLSYVADSMNTILWQPQFSVNDNNSYTGRDGSTIMGATPINKTINENTGDRTGFTLGNNLLLSHKFYKKGRTISLSANANNNGSDGNTIQQATNTYYNSPALNDTINQLVKQRQNTWNIVSEAVYTEPVGKNGRLKLQYGFTYVPAYSAKDNIDFAGGAYSVPDSLLSNTFYSKNIAHRAGGSYLYQSQKYEVSVGVNYQFSTLINDQELPLRSDFYRQFQNVLPVANLQYKFSKTRNLHVNYSSATQVPSVTQLQNVINNNDPLHLVTGDPALKQPYSHTVTLRYNAVNADTKNNFSLSLNGRYTRQSITSSSIIAVHDTTVGNGISLPAGAQLTSPVNIADGGKSINANLSYSMPLDFMKCRLNINTNAAINRTPAIINNSLNYQDNKNAGIGITLNSNMGEHADFSISSNTNITNSINSLNSQLSSTYVNENLTANLNLIIWKQLVFNTALNYQSNTGLSAGYNQNYLLWNISIGKKIFRKHQGDIRLTVFDILNRNNNIQRTFTETYVQDMQTNILQRYAMLVFTYKIREFRK